MSIRHAFGCISSLALAPLLGSALHLTAQQSAAAIPPRYDVIAIHQNKSGSYGVALHIQNATLVAMNIDLANLVSNAYNIRPGLISGFPEWANSARFDIDAKVTDASADSLHKLSEDQRRSMLLALLTDRFHLRAHFEPRILPVYNLVVTKDGPKFKEHPAVSPQSESGPGSNPKPGSIQFGNSEMTATSIPIHNLVWNLSYRVGREVIDKTGLIGTYDFTLKWTPTQPEGETDNNAPDLFTALEEQLGLKLEPSKGPVDTLVVDHVEMPTEN